MKLKQSGFTLVELAIVLVIIGLILGMAFKGKDLIDGAKVKNLQVQYNKIISGINIFYEKYGFFPGDGCVNASPASVAECMPGGAGYSAANRNGRLTGNEQAAFWVLLIDRTNILQSADRRSVFGQDWGLWDGTLSAGGAVAKAGTWLDLPGVPQSDPRLVCALDRAMDDGVWNTGSMRTNGDPAAINYIATTDCWSLSGQSNFHMVVLP
ncbi:prepilin-type N-terminal cleavage/methylation domain-containing protein [Chitinibacter bivalviorum]|uniref:Prepilin-type N-terminal cleavage/methylation domain-containing protein n=1 Tax=Chitinibacter bivalviorum TaxID=2739434 RepID=A0A7H9BFP8_9NEIS|nr:prepilin-type N-terminal cleavage/methylation domain-containing protein [Chitinibacter bivalviorum]QLG87018.1 prepilin-type N-terminal cleavage/methylation domain-containing protein [Chitinibacter bivalviorum]